MKTAAEALIEFLAAQGIDRAFCVPGESYIALLDALHAHPRMDLVTCRSEGGAGFMAVADGKMTGKPGVVLVSRGPGACNASIAVHTAEQDAVPLILLIGQVEKRDLRRNAFQEIDYARMFGGVAKWVGEATSADQVPELIARAYAMAMQGVHQGIAAVYSLRSKSFSSSVITTGCGGSGLGRRGEGRQRHGCCRPINLAVNGLRQP